MGDTTTGRPLSVLSFTILKMRKLLLLLLLSTTAYANPYMEAIKLHSAVYKYINRVAPTLYILNACESELYVPTFSYSLEQTYKLAMANDDKAKSIVNTIWATHEYSIGPRLENSLILIKQGLRNEETRLEVIEACAALTTTVRNRFHWIHHVIDTR
jgi:hypothetical protein